MRAASAFKEPRNDRCSIPLRIVCLYSEKARSTGSRTMHRILTGTRWASFANPSTARSSERWSVEASRAQAPSGTFGNAFQKASRCAPVQLCFLRRRLSTQSGPPGDRKSPGSLFSASTKSGEQFSQLAKDVVPHLGAPMSATYLRKGRESGIAGPSSSDSLPTCQPLPCSGGRFHGRLGEFGEGCRVTENWVRKLCVPRDRSATKTALGEKGRQP